jgi:hypothetical protein
MDPSVTYTVHSVVEDAMPVKAVLNGRTVNATVPGLVVELVCSAEVHGHSYKFVPDSDAEFDALKALFVVGQTVVATFTKGAV